MARHLRLIRGGARPRDYPAETRARFGDLAADAEFPLPPSVADRLAELTRRRKRRREKDFRRPK